MVRVLGLEPAGMLVIMYEAVEDSVQADCLHRILRMCFVRVVC
jgi:hypothetical protein